MDITTEVAVLSANLFRGMARELGKREEIRALAASLKLANPEIETACFIRDKFSDEEMGLMGFSNIAVMHEPVKCPHSPHNKLLFHAEGDNFLATHYDWSAWSKNSGFAFVAESRKSW